MFQVISDSTQRKMKQLVMNPGKSFIWLLIKKHVIYLFTKSLKAKLYGGTGVYWAPPPLSSFKFIDLRSHKKR
jgi:hypothetical protein